MRFTHLSDDVILIATKLCFKKEVIIPNVISVATQDIWLAV